MSLDSCRLLQLPDELLQSIFECLYTESWYLRLQKYSNEEPRREDENGFKLSATTKIALNPLLVCKQLHDVVRTVFRRRFRGVLNVYDSPGLLAIPAQCQSMAPLIRRLCLPDKNLLWSEFPEILPELGCLRTVELFQVDSFLLVDITDPPFSYDGLAADEADRVYELIMGETSNEYWQSRAAPYIPANLFAVATMQELARRKIEIISHQVFCHLLFRSRLPPRLCSKDLNIAFLVGENRRLRVVGKRWIRTLKSDCRVLCELEWLGESSQYTGAGPKNMRFMTLDGTEEA